MNRWFVASALSLAMLASPARAENEVVGASRKTVAAELKLGGYKPDMKGAALRPYESIFGAGAMLLVQLEADYQFFQKYGSLGVGLSVGYAEKYGKAVLASDPSQASEESVSLRVVPLELLLVYRFDYAAIHWNIPIVPYAKAGVAFVPWWESGANGVLFSTTGVRQAGGKWGYTVIGGLSLLLDVLDPRLARDFDTDVGVNHSYLFAEYNVLNARSFASANSGSYDFSDNFFMFGLMLEF